MQRYVIRRLLLIVLTLFLVSVIVFLLIRLIPGDIVDSLIAEMMRGGQILGEPPDRERLERVFGIDVPMHVQYGRWLRDLLLHGSLGNSLLNGAPVLELIASRIGVTFELGLLAILFSMLISLPIGIYSAMRQDTFGDYLGRSVAIVFIAVPSFWIGTLIMIYPSIWWGWSPSLEAIPFTQDPIGNLKMFLIPSFILGMAMAGTTMRMTRTMMLEVLRQDYIRTAYSKGLRESLVVVRHALRNALIPVVTVIGAELVLLVGGAIIIEQIFALPGTGKLMLQALHQRDYTIVSGINMVVATVVVVSNLLVDLSYAYLDPRIRYG